MEASQAVPPEIQAAADRLGVDVGTLMQTVQQQQPAAAQDVPQADAPAPEVQQLPAETVEQRLERELAESRQETQQVRRMAQVAEEGRVVGSSGGGVPSSAVSDLPNLGSLEPGIRYEYLNGLITDEQLLAKVGPLHAALLKKHEGGAI